MTHRGELFGESPQACPFVALELDRDRRSDRPDYRHRCFAEPTPQPRAIAHQEAYCLSVDFPSCPIFQGWATRAAAQPVPVPPGYEGRGASSTPLPGAPLSAAPLPAPPAQPPLPADVAPVVPDPGEPWPSDAFAPIEPEDAPRQIGAFDVADDGPADTPDTPAVPPLEPAVPPLEPAVPPLKPAVPSTWSSSGVAADEPGDAPKPDVAPVRDDAPVPDFLAGRSEREPVARSSASRPDVQFREKVTREDVVPSWELTDRFGSSLKEDRRDRGGGGGDRFGGLVTAVAVVAILGLGVAGVIFLPGLLSGRGQPATPTAPLITATPTLPGTGSPSLPPDATITPVANEPTSTPSVSSEPTASPFLYRIKAGDQLSKIASRFHVTIADILAANPQITNPDHIEKGQLIVIPQPSASP